MFCWRKKPLEEKKSPSYNLPLFGMRRRLIKKKLSGLRRDYHLAILNASIKALGCDIVEIATEDLSDPFDFRSMEYPYVRDPAVIIHDKSLIISNEGNKDFCSEEIINTVKEMKGYKHKLVKNTYFEGGNVCYIPSKKILLHGLDPGGHYKHKIDPVQTNRQLGKAMHPHGIHVMGLKLSDKVLNNDNLHNDHYYHLDCFMQLLPDGRLIILNKKILCEHSQLMLQKILGDKLIDLAYPGYLIQPVIFNFIAIPKEDSFTLVSPTLPDSVIKSLMDLNLSVITPESVDIRNKHYNKEHAEKVAAILQSEGYEGVNAANLATHLAKNVHGYTSSNGKIFSFEEVKVNEEKATSVDEAYRKKNISFIYGGGGPHCFTTEIEPSKHIKYTL